jgi:hypothetical protein
VYLLHGGERHRGEPPVDVEKLPDRACRRRHHDESTAAAGQAAAELGGPVPVLTLGLPRAPGAADSPRVPDSGKQIVRDRNYSTSHDSS